jgi:drug/metabolite transporter (DMT)-like permease
VHHGVNVEYLNKNCGGTFSIWDRIYGTHQQELEHVPVKLGLRKAFSTGSPILVNLLPFLKSPRPKVKLNNDPLLNVASFLLYIQLLSFISIQQQLEILPGTVFVIFIVLGTIILGFIQEGKRHGWSLWILNLIVLTLAMYFVELFDFQQVLASVIATAGYTSIVVFRNLSSRTKNA